MKLYIFRPQPSKFLPKNISYIFPKKTRSEKISCIFSAFLIFPEMEPYTFQPRFKE